MWDSNKFTATELPLNQTLGWSAEATRYNISSCSQKSGARQSIVPFGTGVLCTGTFLHASTLSDLWQGCRCRCTAGCISVPQGGSSPLQLVDCSWNAGDSKRLASLQLWHWTYPTRLLCWGLVGKKEICHIGIIQATTQSSSLT